jgi:hypothetical protein
VSLSEKLSKAKKKKKERKKENLSFFQMVACLPRKCEKEKKDG